MNKRILSLTLALVMILGTFTAVFAEVTTVEQKAAEFLRDNGVLEGDDKGDLLLDKKLERRDAVVLSARLLGEEEKAENTKFDEKVPSWTDVRTDKFYVPFFAWAETTGRFEGKGEGIFEPRAGLTTQEYATVLLRILGHELNGKDAWKSVMELAKKEGLLENVDAKADDVLMRGNMAVMTLNALGATVKGTGKTLADELNIKLPVPAKLAVEDVYADNLAEVTVELNEAVADSKVLENKEHYVLNKNLEVKKATHVADKNVVLLQVVSDTATSTPMKDGVEYNLKIKGIKELGDLSFDFKARDNQTPFIEKVEALGTKAIKVTFSEPVKEARRQNFDLDGKRILADISKNGREVTLRVFSKLSIGDHELSVKGIEDFAGFKMPAVIEEFEVVEDNVKPEVVSVEATTRSVIVEFSEDVDTKTINNKSVYWMFGKTEKYAKGHSFLTGNKVEFDFSNNELPLRDVDFIVEKVEDYSGNVMDKYETVISAELDKIAPEVVDAKKGDTKDKVVVEFSKPVYMNDDNIKETGNALNIKYYTVKDSKNNTIKVLNVKPDGNKKVELELEKYLTDGEDYSIDIAGIYDTNRYPNLLEPWSGIISLEDNSRADFNVYSGKEINKGKVIDLTFTREMDLETLVNPENYTVRFESGNKQKAVNLSELDADIDVRKGYKSVEIVINYSEKDVEEGYSANAIALLNVKDTKGNVVNESGIFKSINPEKQLAIKGDNTEVKNLEEIVLEFNETVGSADKSEIKFSGTEATIEKIAINDTKVTLTLKNLKLSEVEAGVKVSFTKDAFKSLTGKNVTPVTDRALVNKVAPKINSIEAVQVDKEEKVKITLKFNQKLSSLGEDDIFKVTGVDKSGNTYVFDTVKGTFAKGDSDVEIKDTVILDNVDVSKAVGKQVAFEIEVLDKRGIVSNDIQINETKFKGDKYISIKDMLEAAKAELTNDKFVDIEKGDDNGVASVKTKATTLLDGYSAEEIDVKNIADNEFEISFKIGEETAKVKVKVTFKN